MYNFNSHRKATALLVVAIFLLSTLAIGIPVQAHFTLGNLTSTYRFHSEDFDPHVSGVVGYVWPGGGLNAYTGVPNAASSVLSPGYQSPYPCTLAGEPTGNGGIVGSSGNAAQCNPTGAPTSSWYQLQGSAYAPFGAVLTGSTGDLIFAINATANTCPGGVSQQGLCSAHPFDRLGWSGVTIFLPPGFTVPVMDGSNVVTTITNSYANIQVWKVSPYDRYAPGWTAVNMWVDGIQDGVPALKNGVPQSCASSSGLPGGTSCTYYNHQYINFTSAGEWYYFRINQVTAPTVAGRYFFKILLQGDSNYLCGQEGTAAFNSTCSFPAGLAQIGEFPPTTLFNLAEAPTQFIPTQNWPVLLVKGEIDPAIVTGTVRYAGYNSTLYGQPIGEAGRVYAHMEDKIDPYTGQQITTCPAVGQPSVPGCTDAMGYFNATATGHYEVEGVAPGVYTMYAQAAGFPTQVCASAVTVLKGQSLHFDCYVQPGPVIHGNVFTKHQFGDEPWPLKPTGGVLVGQSKSLTDFGPNTYIKIEFYDSPTLSNIPDPSTNLVSWSPLPCVAGGQDLFYPKSSAVPCGDPTTGSQIAFPWHEYTPCNGYLSRGGAITATSCPYKFGTLATDSGYYQVSQGAKLIPFASANPLLLQDPEGVGPPQNWFVQGGTTIPFHFEFGVKAEYGAPRDLDGMVPQVYATWVNGLTPGRYYARAWVFRYVQTALDGSTFQEYYFDITPQEWAGDVTLPIDLRLSSWVNKTVHFHDQINSLIEDPINTGGGFMTGYLVGADGNIYSYNQTALGINCLSATNPTIECVTGVTRSGPGVYYVQKGGGDGWFVSNVFDLAHAKFGPPTYGGFSAVPHGMFGHSPLTGANLDPDGVNSNAIQEGRANIQFWGIDKTWSGEDYGIPSGTYSPFTQVLGYNAEGPPEQVSVTLSGTVTSISDHMIRGPGFNVTLYSVDWERPTVNRAWEFGNPEGWTFREDTGLWGSDISGNSRSGFINSNSVGLGIDLGAYINGTLADWTGDDQAALMASSIGTTNLFQNQFENNVTLNGGGFAIINPAGALFDANQTWFGSEVWLSGSVGGYLGLTPLSFPVGAEPFLPAGTFHNVNELFGLPHFLLPTAFTPGEYNFGGFTYGYVQDQAFSVFADNAQIADVRINLVIGVNITLDVLFKKEHVITPTDFNMSGRVRIFNDQGQLVGEWMSSEGTYVPPNNCGNGNSCVVNGVTQNGRSVAADGTAQFPFGPVKAVIPQPLHLNSYNFIPGGTTLLHVTIAGIPQVPAGTRNAPAGLPVFYNQGDPVFTPYGCAFILACYSGRLWVNLATGKPTYILPQSSILGSAVGYPFPYTGIAGYPDYQGGWTAEVDFVPWYANNTSCAAAAGAPVETTPVFDTSNPFPVFPIGGGLLCNVLFSGANGNYYPPVDGLLLGESYHIIPGTTATSGISLTEDAALSSTFLGHSMVFNHLGPYSQEGVWQVSGTHLSGEASGIFEVDLNGFISGTALAFTWANDFRPLSWATVSVTGASSATWNYYTFDGQYGMYLPGGSYSLTIASPGIASQTLSVAVTGGEVGTAGNVYMQQSNIPVPEFSGLAVVAFTALAASLYILRRRHK